MMKRMIAALCLVALLATPAMAEGWEFDAILYGWLAGLDGTMGVGQVSEPIDASFSDLAGFVDFAIAGHFEAKNLQTVLIADVVYTGLGDTGQTQVGNQPVDVTLDINQWIMELGGGYRVTPEFDVLMVGRYYILDMGATTSSIVGDNSGGTTESWGDIYVGARYTRPLSKKLFFSIRGDIGTGGSEFAWFGDIALGYRFSEKVSAELAWRVLSLDYDGSSGDNYFKYDVVQSGLAIGVGYSF